MDNESIPSALGGMHRASPQLPLPLGAEDLRSWSPSRYSYESAGARSSRIIIESSSYHTTPCGSPPKESPQNLNVKRIDNADHMPQEISRQKERRNCAISDNPQANRRRNSRRDKVEEARSCDLAAGDCYEEMSERSKGELLNFNSCEGDSEKASMEVSK